VKSIGVVIRRALTRARRGVASPTLLGRATLAVGVATGLFTSALGPTSPVRADAPEDPAARLQIVVKGVYIYDDNDWFGSGNLKIFTDFENIDAGPPSIDSPRQNGFDYAFHASTGESRTWDRLMPREGDTMAEGVSPETGIPVYGGHQYQFRLQMTERDPADILNTHMGTVVVPVDDKHNWGIGSYDMRSTNKDDRAGDFQLYFEIHRIPMPDLWVKAFQVAGSPGSEFVCGQIENAGPLPSEPFGVTLLTEGTVVEKAVLSSLGAGESIWHCFPRSSLPAKKHNLVFSLDEARQVPEMEEYNNVNVLTVEADPNGKPSPTGPSGPPSAPAPAPSPQPIVGPVDLTVKAIKVNGEAPNGKDDCAIGKNEVTVVVKNGGTAESGSFAARLVVDGDETDQTVESIRGGEEREVTFMNVQLKKGEHTLKAIADAEHAVDETKEDNNERKVSARCTLSAS
jgi:hypothetical protein